MSPPLVTLVIPVYNGADYLGEAIESALAQTYPAIEVLVVDDGSSDDGATAEVMRRFGARIRCLHKPNGGVATALNMGIEAMRGSLFSWLSHDDLYRPDKVARQVAAMLDFKRPCIVIGDYEAMGPEGERLSEHVLGGWNLVARPLDAVFHGLINGCTLLIPRHLFRVVGMFEPGLPTTQDYELWYRMARAVPFVHCPFSDVRQRIHPAQGSRRSSHRDEAGRLFANLIDRTPPEVMRAYDGTELRFLLRARRSFRPYPPAERYLTFRIGEMTSRIPVAGLTLAAADGKAMAGALLQGLRALSAGPGASPRDLVHVGVGSGAGGEAMAEALGQAIETLILTDADIVVPSAHPSDPPPLDGLLMRLGAAGAFAASLDADGRIDWTRVAGAVRVERLPAAPAALPTREETDDQDAADAQSGQAGFAGGDAGMRDGAGPALLFLADPSSVTARTHLDHVLSALSGRVRCLIGYGHADGRLAIVAPGTAESASPVFKLPAQGPELRALVRRLGVARVDVQHTAGFDIMACAALAALDLPFDLTPLDESPPSCLDGAQRVIALSHAVAAGITRLSPAAPLVHAAPWAVPRSHVFRPRVWREEPLRVLLLGGIGDGQGRRTVIDVAALLRARALPVRFHLFGSMALSAAEAASVGGVLVDHGRVAPDRFIERVSGAAPHVAWLPLRQSEAWSHALSRVMDIGLPLAASDVAGLRERCQGRPHTWLLPSGSDPQRWVRHFLDLHASGLETPTHRAPAGEPSVPRLAPQPARGFFFKEYLVPVHAAS